MAGPKTNARPRIRIGKKMSPAMATALKQLKQLKDGQADHSEVVESCDAMEANYESERANMTLAQKRADLVKSLEERRCEKEQAVVQREKDIGASKQTIEVLKRMATDPCDFLRLCELWNTGDPGIKKSKSVFQDLETEEGVAMNGIMTEAWRHRPQNCENLRSALLIYSKQFIEINQSKGPDFLIHSARKRFKVSPKELDQAVKPPDSDENAVTVTVFGKLELIKEAIAKLDHAHATSQRNEFFPNCYRFVQQQNASREVRAAEFHLGCKMDKKELYERWPIFRPLIDSKVETSDVDPSVLEPARPPSPSLKAASSLGLKAAEAGGARFKSLEDKTVEHNIGDEEDREYGGGYAGEQGDVFRRVFGDDSDGEDSPLECDGPREEGAYAEPTDAPSPKSGAHDSVDDASVSESGEEPPVWRHDDEDMLFAQALAARSVEDPVS